MNQKRFSNTVLVIVLLLFVLIAGYFLLIKKPDLLNPPLVETPFEYLGNFDSPSSLGCISTFDSIENRESREREFVINSGEEYQSLITYKSISSLCKDFVLPTIDFSQKTLLGKYASGGGCAIEFDRDLYKDDLERKVVYIIDVVEKGACQMMGVSMNWVLTSKIPSDYLVQFQVK